MKIIGISCFYHDAAAALVIDGVLIAASSEERFTRKKHDSELPVQAVQFCLGQADCSIRDIDYIVFYDKPLTKFDRILTGQMATPFVSYKLFLAAIPIWLRRKLWVDHIFHKELGFEGETLFIPHHLSHAAGSYFSSPFDKAAILTIDGVGEWATASYGIAHGNEIEILAQMNYPHSVGLFYSAFTQYLGFRVNSAEYKLMGLAAYGQPHYVDLLKQEVIRIHHDGSIHLNLKMFEFHKGLTMIGRSLEQLFGRPGRDEAGPLKPFHHDLAASVQAITEEIVLKMARHVHKTTGQKNLCLSGGVALNCQANGKLLKEKLFDNIYVQPAAGDAGGAVGAALYVWHKLTGTPKRDQKFFGLGPAYTQDEIGRFLSANEIPRTEASPMTIAATIASEIEKGKIVAIFQGGAEFGPRALGFRSILADPRDISMKRRINEAVKYRESFRPFAPAVLAERASEFFDCESDSPYMLFNFQVRGDKQGMIPAVTHIDNSARIQTVRPQDNLFFHNLLTEFYQLTNVPVLLNTSFNLRGWPIVNSPKEAFQTFSSGGIDILVIENYVVYKDQLSRELLDRFAVKQISD